VRQLILHGDDDEAVPVDLSRRYAAAAAAAGDDVDYVELVGGDHMAFLDPASVAHAALKTWLDQLWPVTAPLP
jgi:pimeloyl-ACP methyl ester carboxylesterase